MEYFVWIIAFMSFLLSLSLQAEVAKIKRRQREKERGICDSLLLQNTLSENKGKEVKLIFYHTGDFTFSDKIVHAESEFLFKILDFDDTYVLAEAILKRKKNPISGRVLLPIKNIRSIEREEKGYGS